MRLTRIEALVQLRAEGGQTGRAILTAACSPEGEATGWINTCAAELNPSYNPKVMD